MAKSKVKGGGTKKVCLPASKVRSMSKAERDKVVRAKRSAAAKGDYKRSSKSNVKGARKKGATLRDWFEKENWINVATGEPCGASSSKRTGRTSPAKKISAACKAAAKKKFDVWPSAYASGWGVRCTKAGGPGKMGKSKKK